MSNLSSEIFSDPLTTAVCENGWIPFGSSCYRTESTLHLNW